MKKLLIRLCALSFTLLFASLLWVYGKGAWLSEGVVDGSVKASSVTEIPPFLSTDAWVVLAQSQLDEAANFSPEALANKAQSLDLVSGRPLSFLLGLYVLSGRADEASSIANLADKLWPIHIYSRTRLADYWLSQGRTDKYLNELSLLATRDRSLQKVFFPQIEQLAVIQKPSLLAPFISEPPAWWDSFFSHLKKTQSIQVLEQIVKRRVATQVPLSSAEKAVMVSKLRESKRWASAFDFWLEGLDAGQRKLLVNGVYDGGFEEAKFKSAFGWKVRSAKNLRIGSHSTYGALGRKALQVEFRQGAGRIKFNHLYQHVLLGSGAYELQLKYRLDTLKTTKGLVWRVRCFSQKNKLLAESKALLGRQPWKVLSLKFTVPSGCEMQSISLEAVSKYAHDHVFKGRAWFDDVKVVSKGIDVVK
jgi:hypothetical protein